MHVILLVWLLGVFVYLGHSSAYFKLGPCSSVGVTVEQPSGENLAEMQALVGVKREIGLIYCPLVLVHCFWLKPTIVLPELVTEEEFGYNLPS